MTMSPMESADLGQRVDTTCSRRGVLDVALPAPAGWERGLAVPWYSCGEPILRDKCILGIDEAHRPGVVEYPAFPIEQGSTCSTLSGLDHDAFARARLDATVEWALGRQLATDQVGTGAPSLDDAQLLGSLPGPEDVVWAVSCLEQAAADTGYGSPWVLHTSVRGAAYARRYKMMDPDGCSPAGMPWVISPGYPSTGETDDTVRFWVTGPLWAAVGDVDVHGAVDWRENEDTTYAMTMGMVAFDPCINFAYDVTVGACGAVVPPDTETLQFSWRAETLVDGGRSWVYIYVATESGDVFPAGTYDQAGIGVADLHPVGQAERTTENLFGAQPLVELGGTFEWAVSGPYGINFTVSGTGATDPANDTENPIVLESGTVTYTRPVTT